jgi:hypothetical protein
MWIAGFDPGGSGSFGWCLAEAEVRHLPIIIHHSGVTNNALDAMRQTLAVIPKGAKIDAAGIDSPMYWTAHGDRKADLMVRRLIHQCGCPTSGGTVQNVNSLRGACLVQGILTAHLLRKNFPLARITESHPKALLWLMSIARKGVSVESITTDDLQEFFLFQENELCHHRRDAGLGALSAWAMLSGRTDWKDLLPDEDDPFSPVPGIEYWMPVPQ